MQNSIVALILGLIGGVGGALIAPHLGIGAQDGDKPAEAVAETNSALQGRVESLEARVAKLSTPQLVGTATSEDGETVTAVASRLDAIESALDARIAASVEKKLEERETEEEGEDLEGLAQGMRERMASRKKMNLADASRELGLTGVQEDTLRQAMSTYEEKVLAILAGEDGDTEAVKADLAKLRENPDQGMMIMAKYMPRVMPKMGEMMKLEMERRSTIRETVGDETARKLEREYEVEELQPLGMGGGRMRMRMGR